MQNKVIDTGRLCDVCNSPILVSSKLPIRVRESRKFCKNECRISILTQSNKAQKGTHRSKQQKPCEVCQTSFYPVNKSQKTCSLSCRNKWLSLVKSNMTEEEKKETASHFGKFVVKGYKHEQPMSQEQRDKLSKALTGRIFTKETKRKISESTKGRIPWNFNIPHSEETRKKIGEKSKGRNLGKPMSLEARIKSSLSQRGEKNHNWQGGLTEVQHLIRNSAIYKLWRNAVVNRDNYTCVLCGVHQHWDKEKRINIKVQADHVVTFSLLLERYNIKTLEQAINCEALWNIDNGRTLCEECHRKTETFGWKALKFKKSS